MLSETIISFIKNKIMRNCCQVIYQMIEKIPSNKKKVY